MAQTPIVACLAIAGAWLLIGLLAAASAVAWWRVDLDIELYRWTIVGLAIVSEFMAPAGVYVMGLPGRYMSRQVACAGLIILYGTFNVVGSYHAATGFQAEISSQARAEERRGLAEDNGVIFRRYPMARMRSARSMPNNSE
ncbi:MAG: hypothetical protein SGJ23_16400 [Alphaproteobacteria bacterium]|nr:hypothetical protein [Alphaproteobacteria bacterium]